MTINIVNLNFPSILENGWYEWTGSRGSISENAFQHVFWKCVNFLFYKEKKKKRNNNNKHTQFYAMSESTSPINCSMYTDQICNIPQILNQALWQETCNVWMPCWIRKQIDRKSERTAGINLPQMKVLWWLHYNWVFALSFNCSTIS